MSKKKASAIPDTRIDLVPAVPAQPRCRRVTVLFTTAEFERIRNLRVCRGKNETMSDVLRHCLLGDT